MNQPEPNELTKRYRMTRFLMVIVLAVQLFVLAAYYFKEKQTILAFPMIVTSLFLALALTHLRHIKPRD